MIFEPVIAVIYNLKLDRYHPVYFTENPLPGGQPVDGRAARYKSGAHHTNGFSTREEALSYAKDMGEKLKPNTIGSTHFALEKDFPWDGEDIPAMVVFFLVNGDTAEPLF